MFSVVCERTGRVLAKDLTMDAVDKWVDRNEAKYASIRTAGTTIFVGDAVNMGIDNGIVGRSGAGARLSTRLTSV